MPNVVVVGTQWGDEGKGKVVDVLAPGAAAVIRFQGGNNAGHTLVVDGRKIVLHLLPSGVLHGRVQCLIGNGVVVDPAVLLQEVDELKAHGVSMDGRLWVAGTAHVIGPWHPRLDRAREAALGSSAIGTTNRVIGPAYEDKTARRGLRVLDLVDPARLRVRLTEVLETANRALVEFHGLEPFDVDAVYAALLPLGERIRPWVVDGPAWIERIRRSGGALLFEGAQGTFLDVDHGSYPYVTSSNTVAGAACAGAGVGPSVLHEVVGIAKAYTTRVGGGPFPTEVLGEVGERLRGLGDEFGATTGRPRRCGWFDVALVRRAAVLNGLTRLALTKLDVLSHFDEIPLCVGYEGDEFDLAGAVPRWETWPGWRSDLSAVRRLEDLPLAARRYVARIETMVDVPVELVSVGPGRESTIRVGTLLGR